MKKYLFFLLLVVFIIADIFIANTITGIRNNNKIFKSSGYILKYSDDSQRYYFTQESKYKKTYNNQIVFKDTENEKVVVDKNNFIHYDDGSISSFSKGVLMDLEMIDSDPITYYNVSANKVLRKLANNKYVVKNLNNDIQFTNLMWKISNTKYLIASNYMKIIFSDETQKDIKGFIEIEYADNEVVRIYNQEVKYETISSNVYLQIEENIKINLGNKVILKNDEKKMSLENMVIDSNDNITIKDEEEYKKENNATNSSTENNAKVVQEGGTGSTSSSSSAIANGGTSVIVGDDNNQGKNTNAKATETEIKDDLSVNAPKYTIKEFEVTSTGLKALVEIQDDEARLITGTTTSIVKNSNGEVTYSMPETGKTEIQIDTSALESNTEYTLVMEASYSIENVEYKKNFVYKIFRTPILGVSLEKDLFTSESLSFNIKFELNSPVTKLDVELLENGQLKEGIINNNGSTEKIQFSELSTDTQYTVQIKNIYVNNVSNSNTYSYTYKTLKAVSKLANGTTHCDIKAEIDKWNSKFILSIPDLNEGLVETLNYNVYTIDEGKETLVYNKLTSNTSITLPISDKIQRNKDYYCRTFATFYDNEKIVEYEIANTPTSFNMNSSEMPTIRFETQNENSITFNSIKGNIVIDDGQNTINSKTAKVEIIYSSTTKGIDDSGTLSYRGIGEELIIPIDLKELKSNETYKFSVYATYDLYDNNGERYGYIGSIMITTKQPIPMQAIWTPTEEEINLNLRLTSTQNSDLEAQSLYSFNLALYLGQEGASNKPIATTQIVDNGVDSFAASLKSTYYNDNGGLITKNTFGLTDAQMKEIEEENNYCTVVLTNAKDYVSKNKTKNFENSLPITSNSISYQISMSQISNPSNPEDAIENLPITKTQLSTLTNSELEDMKIISTNTYDNISAITSNTNINNTTVVAYKTKANIAKTQLDSFKYFEYFMYDANNRMVAQSGMIEKNEEKNEVPVALFLISNGENNTTNYISRGNTYYYTYFAYSDNLKNGKYPIDEDEEDYWINKGMPSIITDKQEPNVIMYPSTSDYDSISYKYKISDIDNAMPKKGEKKYFYQFYANAEMEDNNKQIQEGINSSDENGYWTVKFDQLSAKQPNYNLEIKILQSTNNNVIATYRTLTTQKFETILANPTITSNFVNNSRINATIQLGNLASKYINKIAKVKVELIDKAKNLPNIEIEKTAEELSANNMVIDIKYLDIIYQTSNSIKNAEFDVKVKLYYVNGVAGYDNGTDEIAYQTLNNEWLKIYSNKEFGKIINENGSLGNPIAYNLHTYKFNNNEVIIKQDGTEVSWLNYSSKGLIRKVETEKNVVIIPKKVKEYDIGNVGTMYFNEVIPGLKSINDLVTTPGPTNVNIKLNNIYYKDTMILNGVNDVWVELYDGSTNTIVTSPVKMNDTDGLTFNNLTKQKAYYYKLYVNNNGTKIYLYDIDKKTNVTKYEFSTLSNVDVTDLEISYNNEVSDKKRLIITHSASISAGYKGFKYEILDNSEKNIEEEILYSVDNQTFETTDTGIFYIGLEEFNSSDTNFGTVYIDVNRNTFFEYDINYKIRVTPIILNSEDEIENIGNSISKTYVYSPILPEMILYSKRVENSIESEPYIEFSISISDDDDLVTNDNISYKVYKNGNLIPILSGEKVVTSYSTIRIDKSTLGENFNFENSYKVEVSYKYYTSNKDNNFKETVTVSKVILPITNGIYTGKVGWTIKDNTKINLKFYDSYELSNVKSIKCSIYDVNGRILKNVPTINNVLIVDNTSDIIDPHKSITFDPEYEFEVGKSYIISIRFLNEEGNTIASFEPESPITNE